MRSLSATPVDGTAARPLRVLIADDSIRVRNGLRALLGTWPEVMLVGEATNGQEAVQLVLERRPDVVLMDSQMPVIDGLEATRCIKDQCPAVIVILLTMYSTQAAAARAAGADAFLIKQGASQQLRAALGVVGASHES